jgi:hypothetical protein
MELSYSDNLEYGVTSGSALGERRVKKAGGGSRKEER